MRRQTRALVTGATKGSGGRSPAARSRGATVGLLARNEDDLAALAGELGGGGPAGADVADRDALEAAVEGSSRRPAASTSLRQRRHRPLRAFRRAGRRGSRPR